MKSETVKEQCRPQIKRQRAQFQKLHSADKIKLYVTQRNKERSFSKQIEE